MEQQTNMTLNQQPQLVVNQTDGEDEIDLAELFYLLWRHALQILAALLVGAVLAFGVTYFFMTPMYKASASMYVVSASNNSIVNLTDLQIGTQLTADYQELLLSRPLLESVIDNLDLEMTPSALEGEISVTNTNDTRIMTVTVTDADPEQAADIANEVIHQAKIYLPKIMETETPNVVEDAVVPTHRSSPSYSKNTVLGALVGAVLCCAVYVVQFLLNDTFETPDDIAKYFGTQPLATIPEGEGMNGEEEKKKNALTRKFQRG